MQKHEYLVTYRKDGVAEISEIFYVGQPKVCAEPFIEFYEDRAKVCFKDCKARYPKRKELHYKVGKTSLDRLFGKELLLALLPREIDWPMYFTLRPEERWYFYDKTRESFKWAKAVKELLEKH